MKRVVAVAAVALVVGATAAVPTQAAVRTDHKARIWQRACERRANGEVSPQPALVCVHTGFPLFSDADLELLRHVCVDRLGGTFQYRSEFPVELALCSLD